MRINFDFTDLEAFLAVKETGSFHLASERLNVSQSSITRRVRKLEEALGTVLFSRTTREVKPTLAAKRLQIRAEGMLEEAREAHRAMRDESAAYAHQRAQTVTLAVVPTVVTSLLAPAIARFRMQHPRARIRLLDLSANDVAEAVAQGEADFGICSIPVTEPTTSFEPLFDDPIVIAMAEGNPLAVRKQLTWADLSGEALILPARGTGNRLMIDEALARARRPLHWTYEVGRSTTALDLVAANVGIAPLPKMALAREERREVCWRPVAEPEVVRPVGLLTRTGQSESAVVAALKRAMREAVQILVQGEG